MLTRASSYIGGRLYLLMILFRMGLLTITYMDSLIDHAKPCPTLPTMLKLSMVVWWPVMLWSPCMGEGSLGCFLYHPTNRS